MKQITLVNSKKKAKVDDEDYKWLKEFEWHLHDEGYAVTLVGDKLIEMSDMIVRHARKQGRINPDGTIRSHS